jgi:hypothetical protein
MNTEMKKKGRPPPPPPSAVSIPAPPPPPSAVPPSASVDVSVQPLDPSTAQTAKARALHCITAIKSATGDSIGLAGALQELSDEDVVKMPPALGGTQTMRVNIRVARLGEWCGQQGLPTTDAAHLREDMRCFYNDKYNENEPLEQLLNYRTMGEIPQGLIPCIQLEKYLDFWAAAAVEDPSNVASPAAASEQPSLSMDEIAASVDAWKRDRHLPWTSAFWGPGGSGERCSVM